MSVLAHKLLMEFLWATDKVEMFNMTVKALQDLVPAFWLSFPYNYAQVNCSIPYELGSVLSSSTYIS